MAVVLRRVGVARTDAVHGAGVALGDLGGAIDDEARLLVVLVPEVHLRALGDCRLGQREAEAVVADEEPLRAPAVAADVEVRIGDLVEGPDQHLALASFGVPR